MPLIRYSTYIFHPGGDPAAGVTVTVRLSGGSSPSLLRADKPGAVARPNPVQTDPDGLLWFYAPPGDYETWYGGTRWPLLVDESETDEAWPGLFIHEQAVPATTWTIDHWFGVEPAVTILRDGIERKAGVSHPTPTQTVVTFGTPTGGVAHLRR